MAEQIAVNFDKSLNTIYRLPCPKCQIDTRHTTVTSVDLDGEIIYDSLNSYQWNEKYQIVQCLGCETVSFRHESSNSEEEMRVGEDEYETIITEELYPPRSVIHDVLADAMYLPPTIRRIYLEIHSAIGNNQPILSGIGLRALVEAVCKDKRATGSLKTMIDTLVSMGTLKLHEAEILHRLRFMGNESAHETKPHSQDELLLAFQIVEHLLVTVYLLALRASRLPTQ